MRRGLLLLKFRPLAAGGRGCDNFPSRKTGAMHAGDSRETAVNTGPDTAASPTDRAAEKLRILREAASVLASSTEFEQTLANTIGACLPALGDFGFFDVVAGDQVIRTARAHADPVTEAILRPTAWVRQERTDINLCALSSGQPALHRSIDDDWYVDVAVNDLHLDMLRRLAFRSMVTVPMRYRGELIGSLTLFMAASGRQHDEDDLAFADDLAALAAPLVTNARLLKAQREAEEALRASEERLRLAIDASKAGIWDWQIPDDRVIWSDSVYRLHGVTPGEFGGRARDFLALVHPDDRPMLQDLIAAAMRGDGVFTAEFRTVLPDGEVRWFLTRANMYRDAAGKVVRLVGATFDITERINLLAAERAARAEAESANRAKDEFLAMLGHELRNPLAPISLALQSMERRGDPASERERAVIARQVNHMSRLVDDLLDISRITQGKISLAQESIDIVAVIRDTLEFIGPALADSKLHLMSSLPTYPIRVRGDGVRLAQVFHNLLNNAVKFTPPGGRIGIEATADGRSARVQVSDTGAGIAAELIPQVFDPFVQAPQQSDRRKGGLGLGLAIASRLVAMHGGAISVRSNGPGLGCVFEVTLPLADSVPQAMPPDVMPQALPRQQARGRILVVDDNVDAGDMLAQYLTETGYAAAYVSDGPAALARIRDDSPDIAILDIGMPAMDGYELAEEIRRIRGRDSLRLIALTGYGRQPDRQRAFDAGFDAHFVKPVDIGRLVAWIEDLLKKVRVRAGTAGVASQRPDD